MEVAAMRWLGLVFAVVVFGLNPCPAGADVHAIPLPELVGEYQAWDASFRTTTLTLPGVPAEIRGASLRLRGSAEAGVIVCPGPFGPVQHPWVTQFVARMYDDSDYRVWSIENAPQNPPGTFEWTIEFRGWSVFGAPLPSWNFLLDGTAPLEFVARDNNVVLGCGGIMPPPRAWVEEAVLLLDADFAVPAKPLTWGRVKAAYR
jgi:hypothetical protein